MRDGNPLRAQVEALFQNMNKQMDTDKDMEKDNTAASDYYDFSSTSVSENISTRSSRRGGSGRHN